MRNPKGSIKTISTAVSSQENFSDGINILRNKGISGNAYAGFATVSHGSIEGIGTAARDPISGGTVLRVNVDLGRNLNVPNRGIIDYEMGQAIARGARKHGFNSITFCSAQNPGGVNIVVFDPSRIVRSGR